MSHLLKYLVLGLYVSMSWGCTKSDPAGVGDTPASTADSSPSSTDMHRSTTDMHTTPADLSPPSPDRGRLASDATLPASDASTSMTDMGTPSPDATPPNPERPEYEGLGLAPVESNLYLRPVHLEQTVTDNLYFSFLVRRLLPRVEGMGDTSQLQPWLMYRPSDGPEWLWLLMGFYLPNDATTPLPPLPNGYTDRVEAGRIGSWYRMSDTGLTAVPAGAAASVLAESNVRPVCGQAILSARFNIRLPDGAIIQDVIGVVMTISQQATLDLSWLRGCGRDDVP